MLVAAVELNSSNPFFLEIGIPPDQLSNFGVQVVDGQPFTADATDEIMLGYRAASNLNKIVGDTITVDSVTYRIVGIFSTGQVFGDEASMLPLSKLQTEERKPGEVTLIFVTVKSGTDIAALRAQIEHDSPGLATVQSVSEFGRVDRNLSLISAANVGVSVLALFMGAVGVMNTTLMSVFERTREFGVLRAVGWSRGRLVVMVMAEALLIALAGAMVGTALGLRRGKGHPAVAAGGRVLPSRVYSRRVRASAGRGRGHGILRRHLSGGPSSAAAAAGGAAA